MYRGISIICATVISSALGDPAAMALGAHTNPGDYPWVVSVKSPAGTHVSTGILVDSQTVVVPGPVGGGIGWTVVAGAADLANPGGAEMAMVAGVTVHPDYGSCGSLPDCSAAFPHNIAYLQLATPLSTPPAVFAPSYLDFDEEVSWMVGWWQTDPCTSFAQFDPQQRFASISPTSTGVVISPDRMHGTLNGMLGTAATGSVIVVDWGGTPAVAGFLSFSDDACDPAQPHTFTNTGYFHGWIPGVTTLPPLTGRDVVRVTTTATGAFLTSGIVVDPRWILTTGNDVDGMHPSELTADGIQVTCITYAPAYGLNACGAPVNDLALLKLSEPTFSPVQELATGPDTYAQDMGTALWWLWNGSMNSAAMPIINNSELASHWGATCISDGNIGVFPATDDRVLSGGLYVGPTLVGMASWWRESGIPTYQDPSRPYVYTRISEYADWIQETLPNGTTGPCADACLFVWTGAGGDASFDNPANWSPNPGFGGPSGSVLIDNPNTLTWFLAEARDATIALCELRVTGTPSPTSDGASTLFAERTTVTVDHDVTLETEGSITLFGWPGERSRLECEDLRLSGGTLAALTNSPTSPANHELECRDLTVDPGGWLVASLRTNFDVQTDTAAFGGSLTIEEDARVTMNIIDSVVDNTGRMAIGKLIFDDPHADLTLTASLHNKAGASFDGLAFSRVANYGVIVDGSTLAPTSLVNWEQGYVETTGDNLIDVDHGTVTNAGWVEVVSGTTDVRGSIDNVSHGLIRIRPGAVLQVEAFTGAGESILVGTVEETSPPASPMAGLGPGMEPVVVVASDLLMAEAGTVDMEGSVLVVAGHVDLIDEGALRMKNATVIMQGDGRRFSVQYEARADLRNGTLRVEGWPVVLEAFSPERGQVVNPAEVRSIGTIDIAEGSAIVLVDEYPNGDGGPDVLYVEHVVLRSGSVLDLNGGRMFYGEIEDLGGEIVNGEVVPASFCSEDLDGDGAVGFSDLTQLLAAWGPCAGCVEDMDVDDQVGFSDLTQLLAAWGPCGAP